MVAINDDRTLTVARSVSLFLTSARTKFEIVISSFHQIGNRDRRQRSCGMALTAGTATLTLVVCPAHTIYRLSVERQFSRRGERYELIWKRAWSSTATRFDETVKVVFNCYFMKKKVGRQSSRQKNIRESHRNTHTLDKTVERKLTDRLSVLFLEDRVILTENRAQVLRADW